MADRNGYIGRAPSDSSVVVARQTFQPTGITTTFTFASGYVVGYLDVFLNGAKQIEGQDYDANNGSTFEVSGGGATNGDVIEAVAYKAFNVSALKDAPGDFTVGNNLTVVGHTTATQAVYTGVVTASSFSGDGSALTGVAGGKFSANDTGISTTTSVGIGTTNATGAADSNNTAVLNVGVVTANFFYGNGSGLTGIAGTENIITGTAATFTNVVKVGTAITLDATSGIITAVNGFVGDLTGTASLASNLTGTPDITVRNITGVAATFTGVLTYEDVTSVDSVGIVTARGGVELGAAGVGGTFSATGFGSLEGGLNVTGVVTATSFEGDGSALTGIAVGLNTAASTVSGIVTTLLLSSAQDHKLTVSGITTITCSGGTEGDSHTVRIINSGITTVGFSTFFLFPSGADPSMPTSDGAISLISFTVNRVGAGGTQLLAGAALNYS
jgi:hypothetical protein